MQFKKNILDIARPRSFVVSVLNIIIWSFTKDVQNMPLKSKCPCPGVHKLILNYIGKSSNMTSPKLPGII